jgi:hypothetical protein
MQTSWILSLLRARAHGTYAKRSGSSAGPRPSRAPVRFAATICAHPHPRTHTHTQTQTRVCGLHLHRPRPRPSHLEAHTGSARHGRALQRLARRASSAFVTRAPLSVLTTPLADELATIARSSDGAALPKVHVPTSQVSPAQPPVHTHSSVPLNGLRAERACLDSRRCMRCAWARACPEAAAAGSTCRRCGTR